VSPAFRRIAFRSLLVLLTAVTLAFIAIPIVALFVEVPLRRLPDLLGTPAVGQAIAVTVRTNLIANALILAVGTPTAYLLATSRFPGRAAVITLIELPLVMPPAVAGIGLLAAFGARGMLGSGLAARGLRIPFTELAVVLAVTFVAAPFYLRQAIASFQAVDPTLVAAARTLGAGPARAFARIALPLAAPGLGTGWALAFARGIGEFGATLFFAGSIAGITQTIPLAIYEQLEVSFDTALALGVLLVCLSGAVLILAKLVPGWTRSASTSAPASVPSR
jgi:molybdate transport system permease protein